MQQRTSADIISLILGIVGFVADAIALATFFASFRGIEPRPTSILVMAVGGGAIFLLWVVCLVGIRKLTSARLRGIALAGVVGIPLIALVALTSWGVYQRRPPEDIIVLVMEIDGPDPERYRVTENILSNLRSELADIENARVAHLARSVSEGEGAEVARALGTRPFGSRDDATIVIWGWYGPTATHVQVALHFELLRQPPLTPPIQAGEPRTYEIAQLEGFTLQTELSREMIYLSAFVAGMAHYGLGDYEGAQQGFTIALSQPESSRSLGREVVLFYRANASRSQGLHDQAIADYTEAIRLNANFVEAYNNRGTARADLGEYDQAIADYTEAIRIDPNFAVAYNNRGFFHAHLGEYDQAIADYTEAIRLDPSLAAAYNNRGLFHAHLGEHDQAIADYTEALRIDSNYAAAYYNRGLSHHNLGEYDQAIADYTEAIRIDLGFAWAYYTRGLLHAHLGEHDQAIADYTEAIRIDANYTCAYNNRGLSHAHLGEHDQAIADYTEAIRIDPGFAAAYNNRGLSHYDLGEHDRAIADYTEALRIDPGFAAAYYNRGLSHYDLGDYKQAIADFESYLLLAAPDAQLWRTHAQQYIDEMQEQQ